MLNGPHELREIQEADFSWRVIDSGYVWDEEATPVQRSLYRYPGSETRIVFKYPDEGELTHGSVHELREPHIGRADPNLILWETRIPPQVGGPFLIEAPGARGWRVENHILDRADLFTVFASLTLQEQKIREGILEFANEYGMLTRGETEVTTSLYSPGSNPVTKLYQSETPYLPAESLSFWRREIIEMKQVFEIWKGLAGENREGQSSPNLAFLRKLIRWNDDHSAVLYSLPVWSSKGETWGPAESETWVPGQPMDVGCIASTDHNPETFKRLRPGHLVQPARVLLQHLVNKKIWKLADGELGTIHPRLLRNQKDEIRSYLVPSNMLAALWLQFYMAVCGERIIKRCVYEKCRKWEDVTDLPRPSRWKGHPSCLNAKRQADYRKRHASSKKAGAKKEA